MSKIIKGDTVIVISGKDKGKIGNVLKVHHMKTSCKVVVSGVNVRVKHQKARMGSPGSLKKIESPIDISNVAMYCKQVDGPSKVYYTSSDGEKVRKYRKTNEVIG